MIETFTWRTIGQPTGDITLRTLAAQFGDGYSQKAADGINNKTQSWPVQCVGLTEGEANAIVAFLDRQGGYKAFYWTPPLGPQGLYQTDKYAPTHQGGGVYTVSITFEQAFRP